MPFLATHKILLSVTGIQDSHITYNPEVYASAGGELFIVALAVSWTLTYFFNHESIVSNPLKDRVGYNNLCVGWDTLPAKIAAGPIFALIIFTYCRFCQLDYWRAQLDPHMSTFRRRAVSIGIGANIISWYCSIGIFAISPQESPLLHTASFVQLVVGSYIGFLCNILEAEPKHLVTGSIPYTVIFGIVCVAFGVCAMTQMYMYDPDTGEKGPVPWYVMGVLDYTYFGFMGTAGQFRPRAPSVGAIYILVSDDDYQCAVASRGKIHLSYEEVQQLNTRGTTVAEGDKSTMVHPRF
jgi:hypothetical protein